PRRERNQHSRMHCCRFVLQPVARAVQIAMLVGVESLHRPFPGTDLVVEDAADAGRWMEVEMSADVGVRESRRPEQDGSVQRAGGEDDRSRTNEDGMAVARRLHGVRAAAADANASCTRPDCDSRARLLRVEEPCDESRLLRADGTAETATTTHDALLAAAHVSRHLRDVPAELFEAARHHVVAFRRLALV